MKNLLKAYREWRDRKFVERINRVYFKKEKGFLFIEGHLNIVSDGESSGRISAWTDYTRDEVLNVYAKREKENGL